MTEYLPVLVFLVAVLGFAGFSLLAPHIVAPRKKTVVKGMPYESGMDPEGDARKPLDIKFYLLAILFLLFDVELLFVYPWAVAAGADGQIDGASRWGVFFVLLMLMATTALAYLYARQKGVFQWRQK